MHRGLLIVVVAAAAACSADVEGSLHVETTTVTRSFAPTECASGEPLEFFGVDLWDDGDRMLRIVHEPAAGPYLAYFESQSSEAEVVVLPEDCERFDGELKRTDVEINGVWAMRGSLGIDCRTPDGDVLRGEVQFEDCATEHNDYASCE